MKRRERGLERGSVGGRREWRRGEGRQGGREGEGNEAEGEGPASPSCR